MARERRLFSKEFKREAVKLVGQPGASKAAIARDLGIGANLLGHWCRDANVDAEVVSGGEKVSSQEYERMRRELAKVKTERDILKKALVGSTGQCNSSDLMAFLLEMRCRELEGQDCLFSRRKNFGKDGRTANR
jgi:transposase